MIGFLEKHFCCKNNSKSKIDEYETGCSMSREPNSQSSNLPSNFKNFPIVYHEDRQNRQSKMVLLLFSFLLLHFHFKSPKTFEKEGIFKENKRNEVLSHFGFAKETNGDSPSRSRNQWNQPSHEQQVNPKNKEKKNEMSSLYSQENYFTMPNETTEEPLESCCHPFRMHPKDLSLAPKDKDHFLEGDSFEENEIGEENNRFGSLNSSEFRLFFPEKEQNGVSPGKRENQRNLEILKTPSICAARKLSFDDSPSSLPLKNSQSKPPPLPLSINFNQRRNNDGGLTSRNPQERFGTSNNVKSGQSRTYRKIFD